MCVPSPHGHPFLGLTDKPPSSNIMAEVAEPKKSIAFIAGTPVELTIKGALSRGKVFIVFFNESETPAILAKSIAAEDGYVHRSQLSGIKVTFTPSAKSNGTGGDGWLGELDLPMANVSNNSLLADRQSVANKLAMAKVYATNVAEEN